MVNTDRLAARTISRLPDLLLKRLAGDPLQIDGNTLDLQMQAFGALAPEPDQELTPASLREGFDHMVAVAAHRPAQAVAVHDREIPGPAGPLRARVYHPASTTAPAPGIVWYQQGGCVVGGLDTDHALLTSLVARCGAVIVSVDYRLAPEHAFPAWIEDGVATHLWVLDNAEGLGIDPVRLAGTSAGGSISAVVCQEARAGGVPQPAAQILVYPGLDATSTGGGSRSSCADILPLSIPILEFFVAQALPDPSAASDLRASPGLATELSGLAPAVVVTAGFDPLRDDGDRYATALAGAGVPVTHRVERSLTHSFTVFGGSREARRAVDRLTDDVASVLRVA